MKARLMGFALLLTALLAAAVFRFSPYEPVIEPLRPIEELWALEDERLESPVPLVHRLTRDGVPQGYDEEKDTFYIPLPLDCEEWPNLKLYAPDAGDMRLCFADDYLYDSPKDAMAGGYAYRVFAYTKEEFAYFNVVFTGMTQLCISGDEERFGDDDVPVMIAVSGADSRLAAPGRTHYRGGVTRSSPKHAYRLEFTKRTDGRKKIAREVPGLGSAKNIILIPMIYDRTLMRDRLSWDVYAAALKGDEPYGARRMQYTEVFVNDEYQGVYLMLEPFDHTAELDKAGQGHAETDYIYRVSSQKDKPWHSGAYIGGRGFELHYAPPKAADVFLGLREYMELVQEKDDGVFCRKALERLDLDTMLRHLLLVEGGGLTDNILNNMYVWSDRASGKTVYRFFPWDMDATWGDRENRIGREFDYWIYFPTCDRLIDLNPEGLIRPKLAEEWRRLRAGALSEEFIEACLVRYTHELNDSGAASRNAECWDLGSYLVDPEDILTFISVRFPFMDDVVRFYEETEGRIEFLQYLDYENKSGQIKQGWLIPNTGATEDGGTDGETGDGET